MKHQWGPKTDFPLAHKSERTCLRSGCGITKVHHYQHEGDHDAHWYEFWCGEQRIDTDGKTPPCEGLRKTVAYGMQGYPL